MTPEERQLLMSLADRVKSTPVQQKDVEASQLLQQLVLDRPDTVYILAQTVLIQEYALKNAQAQIEDLQRQLSEGPSESGSGSFLGGLFGGGREAPRRPSGSVPNVNPWGAPQGRAPGDYPPPPPPPPGAGYPGAVPGSQQPSFLRSAAETAAGVAGGALLFQGISSLFSGHHGGLLGGGGLMPGGLGETPGSALGHQNDVRDSDYGERGDYEGGDEMGSDFDYGDDGDF